MTPDPKTLMAVNASDWTSDAALNNQALQRKRVSDESGTLAAQATAIPPEKVHSIWCSKRASKPQ